MDLMFDREEVAGQVVYRCHCSEPAHAIYTGLSAREHLLERQKEGWRLGDALEAVERDVAKGLLYDEGCLELAERFLERRDGRREIHERLLAQTIQDAIEDWLETNLPEETGEKE